MKRWIAVLMSLVMVLSLMPMAVMAEETAEQERLPVTTLYVGSVNALETPQGDGWSYDASTSTLTLNNCTLTESMLHVETYQDEEGNVYYDRHDSMIYFDGDLTIELIGTNSVERVVENAPGDYTNYYAICGSLDIPDGWDMPAALKFTGTGNLTVGLAVTADYLSEDGYSMNDAWEYFEFSSGIGVWGGVDLSGLYGGGWMDIYGGVYGVQAHYIACAFANYPTFGDNCIVTAYQDVEGTVENENGYNWNNNDAWRMKVVTGNAILKDNGQLILMDKDSASGNGWTWENQVLTLSEGTEVKAVDFRSRVESAKLVLTGNVTLDATDMGYDANWNAIAAVTAFCDLDINAGDYTLTLNNGWADALRGELCDVTVSGGTVVAANEGSYAVNMIGGDLTIQNTTFRSPNEIYLTEGYDADYNTIDAGDAVLSGAVVVLDSPITSYGALTILNSDVTVTWGYEALYSSTALTVRDSNLSINASGYALASNGNVTVDNCSLDLIAEESVIYRGYYHYEWNDESNIPDASCFQLLNMDITQPEGCTVAASEEVEEYYTKYTVQVVDGNGNAATTMKATAAGNEHEHSYTQGVCTCGKKQTFTITWKDEDGTILEVDTVEYGDHPEYNGPTPTKAGIEGYDYTFRGWSNGTQYTNVENVIVTQDWTYTAGYTSVAHKHYLIFMDSDGVTELGRFEKSYNQSIVITTANLFTWAGKPTKDCYTLSGWYRADGLSNSSFSMPDHDVVFVAIWDGPNHSYEAVVTAPGCGTGGYTTHTCSGCGDSYVTDETEPLGEHSYVEGICSNCGAKQTFTVTWYNWDGTVLEVDTVQYGETPEYNGPTPTRIGVGYDYTFYAWGYNASGSQTGTPGPATSDQNWHAKFTNTVHKHDLIFMDGDLELARKEFDYNKYIYASGLNSYAGNHFEKDCCTHTGWAYADGIAVSNFWMPDEDLVIYAVWDGPNHTLVDGTCSVCGLTEGMPEHTHFFVEGICACGKVQTFTVTWTNWDGTVLGVDTVEYGQIPEYNGETPVKTDVGYDYTFSCWYQGNYPATFEAVTADLTFKAYYASVVHKHDLIFMDGTVELARKTLDYNKYTYASSLNSYAGNPTKACYTLSGWAYADGTAAGAFWMPDEDVVLYAVWDGPNHSWVDATCAAPKTCSGCGLTEGEALEHTYTEGVCSGCGAIQTFTVTWVNWDGTVLETDTVEYGTVPTYDGETPTRPNVGWDFRFCGWALSASGAEVTPGAATKDVTYYAKYTSTVHKHNLIFLDDDGVTELGRYETNYSKNIAASWLSTAAGNPTKACCILTGWTYADGSAVESFYMPDEDVIFVAVWDGPNHMDVDTDADHSCDVCGAESVTEHSYEAVVIAPTCTDAGYTTYTCNCGDGYVADEVAALGHSYDAVVTAPTCTEGGYTTYTCANCGDSYVADEAAALGHSYDAVVTAPTCTEGGNTTYTCANCGDTYTADEVPALGHDRTTEIQYPTCTENGSITVTCGTCGEKLIGALAATGHSYENGSCTACGQADPNAVTRPTLTLKAPALEFKDMIKVVAFFTAENTEDVVEMGMITYTEKVDVIDISTAAHVIPGATYNESTGRYVSASQGIHGKYLGATVYMAIYAKLTDGSYTYTRVVPYSPVQYATNQLKNSTNVKLKQLCAAMLNYGAEAQKFFQVNTDNLANATLTEEQLKLPEAYRADMVGTVPAPTVEKQGTFANNKGFAKRTPSISFEGAFCINYFFTPNYAPVDGITLYYWTEADFAAAEVLTAENATGSFKMDGSGVGQYTGNIEGIAAKNLSEAVYVSAVYSDGTTTWTSGVLGYSIGAYCSSQASKGTTISDLAMATAVYGYHAKQYFGS